MPPASASQIVDVSQTLAGRYVWSVYVVFHSVSGVVTVELYDWRLSAAGVDTSRSSCVRHLQMGSPE